MTKMTFSKVKCARNPLFLLLSPPQALRLRARLDTKWKKKQLKIRAEFMTSVSYRPEVIIHIPLLANEV